MRNLIRGNKKRRLDQSDDGTSRDEDDSEDFVEGDEEDEEDFVQESPVTSMICSQSAPVTSSIRTSGRETQKCKRISLKDLMDSGKFIELLRLTNFFRHLSCRRWGLLQEDSWVHWYTFAQWSNSMPWRTSLPVLVDLRQVRCHGDWCKVVPPKWLAARLLSL